MIVSHGRQSLQVADRLRGLTWALDQPSFASTVEFIIDQPMLGFLEPELIESRVATLAKALGCARSDVLHAVLHEPELVALRVPKALAAFFPELANPRAPFSGAGIMDRGADMAGNELEG